MAKEKFLLVSLSEPKVKQLAQTISNETSRKILDYLADKDATESELAEKLEFPISTVHYNLQQLQKGGLVVVDEFHYSKKGKEINHYKLANKYIIIAPKSTYGLKEKLKSILPVALVMAAGAGLLNIFSRRIGTFSAVAKQEVFLDAAPAAEEAISEAVAAPELAEQAIAAVPAEPNIWLWFTIGAVIALLLFLLVDWIRNKN